MTNNIEVLCPTCKKPVKWAENNKEKPFCSERCKLIDLGAWADEKFNIPGEKVDKAAESSDGNDDIEH